MAAIDQIIKFHAHFFIHMIKNVLDIFANIVLFQIVPNKTCNESIKWLDFN